MKIARDIYERVIRELTDAARRGDVQPQPNELRALRYICLKAGWPDLARQVDEIPRAHAGDPSLVSPN